MSQAQISAAEASSSTKQMVRIKEKLKLDRSATNAQLSGGKLAAVVQLTRQKGRKNREKVQNRVGRKTKFAGSS